jgi:hypothetical protein
MIENTLKIFLFILLLTSSSFSGAQASDQDQTKQTRTSSHGDYDVTIESWMKPLELGRMHAWTASINTTDGKPVTNASIRVGGGMPTHNHGFPTEPEMTKQLEPGIYLIEGLKFSMRGPWIIILDITVDGKTDSVAFDINM